MIPQQRRPPEPDPSYPDGDPRARRDGLGWVTRAVFPDPRLRVTLGATPSATFRYAVIPALDSAKFLLPLASNKVTAASLLAYNALRPAKVRLSRAVLGSLARSGGLGLTRAPIVSVEVPPGAEVLWQALGDPMQAGRLHAAIGVRPPDPHHKPTLQLFDEDGVPRGYAKVGWNDGTRAMVRAEVATLSNLPVANLPTAGGDLPDVPRLLLHTTWQGREVAVIEPMPPGVRRLRHPGRPRLAAMLAVARRGGPPAEPRTPEALFESWHRRGAAAAPAIPAAIDALDAGVELEFGDWHGDWVPWNMAEHRGRLMMWDWENRAPGVPVGFDLAHQAFQTALSLRGLPAARCAEAVDAALRTHGPALGLGTAGKQRFVADAYLIELWLRTYELSHGGAGWNPKLHPALLDALDERLSPPSRRSGPAASSAPR